MTRPTAIVYIDGFNFYKQRVERLPAAKWLDFNAFAARLLPDCAVSVVRYFTTIVVPDADPLTNATTRQRTYVRALTATGVDIHLGRFKPRTRQMRAVPQSMDIRTRKAVRIPVRHVEEKQTDVSIAVTMVADAFRGEADLYVLLSNDSDQVPTLNQLHSMGKQTRLILPSHDEKRGSNELRQTGPSGIVTFLDSDMLECQLPDSIDDEYGTVSRPSGWR